MSESKQHILFPVSNPLADETPVLFAIDFARKSKGKLYILITYRLTDFIHTPLPPKKVKTIKEHLEHVIRKDFLDKYQALIENSAVEYDFSVEIGFLSDRLIHVIKERKIDLLILSSDLINEKLTLEKEIRELNVSLISVPLP